MTKECTIVLIDMVAIVYIIPQTRATTFKEYFTMHMASYVKGFPQISNTRIDGIYLNEDVCRAKKLSLFFVLSSLYLNYSVLERTLDEIGGFLCLKSLKYCC